jgi:hypothetical protein
MIAAALGVSLSGCSLAHRVVTPRYDMTNEQHSHLNMTARLGFNGLDEFTMMVKYPNGIGSLDFNSLGLEPAPVPPVKLGQSFGSNESLDAVAAKAHILASRDDGKDMRVDKSFTPEVRSDETYVTYSSFFRNIYNEATEKVVFRNPDATIFGGNGYASVDQMKKFFRSDRTELVSLSSDEKEQDRDKCKIGLSFDGNKLVTNVADDCDFYVKHTDTAGILEDLESIWYYDGIDTGD